jgi:hypothetical protein
LTIKSIILDSALNTRWKQKDSAFIQQTFNAVLRRTLDNTAAFWRGGKVVEEDGYAVESVVVVGLSSQAEGGSIGSMGCIVKICRW